MKRNKIILNKIIEILSGYLNCSSNKLIISSIVFRKHSVIVRVNDLDNDQDFIIKIPKGKIKGNDLGKIVFDKEIKEIARAEWESLNILNKLCNNKTVLLGFVRPIVFIEKFNVIITEEFKGIDFFEYLKKDKKTSIFSEDIKLGDYFSKIGKSLNSFHRTVGKSNEGKHYLFNDIINLLDFIKIRQKDILKNKVKKLTEDLKPEDIFSLNILGFQIRNILTDDKLEKVVLLDPVIIKKGSIYEDIARLITTTKIIYQNSVFFTFRSVNDYYKNEFLKGYFGKEEINEKLLNLYLLRKFLLMYSQALSSLDSKNIFFKRLIKKYYLDVFYLKEINRLINSF